MENLQIFKNSEFGAIRTTTDNGEPYFMLVDVCRVLGLDNSRQAKTRLNEKGVISSDILTNGGMQKADFINESNLYKLVFQSRKPQAEAFSDWVTSEVLPSIRKHGAYATPETIENIISNPDFGIKLLNTLKEEREKNKVLTDKVEQDKPKVIFAEAVTSSKTSILVGELAKILRQNGVNIGEKRLFIDLREKGYLCKRKGSDWNMPTQRSMEQGLFEIKESTHLDGNGCNVTKKTPKVTGKGQQYFINKYLAKVGADNGKDNR